MGGAYGGILNNCFLMSNSVAGARSYGGGAEAGVLNNCIVLSNSSSGTIISCGGGTAFCVLNNCTVVGNSSGGIYGWGGGTMEGTLRNCIVYYNSAAIGSNFYGGTFTNCCAAPLQVGTGNITNEPVFMDLLIGNLRLMSNSPCIDSGDNSFVQSGWTDMDRKLRIFGTNVDMGAYEFGRISLPIWLTNAVLTSNSHFSVEFQAEPGHVYWLETCINLAENWQTISSPTNCVGWTTLFDTYAGGERRFYRVGSAPFP